MSLAVEPGPADRDRSDRPGAHRAGRASGRAGILPGPLLAGVCLALILPELVLSGADHGLWGDPLWRGRAIQYGGFWPGLLDDWRPNYAVQPWTMFVSYILLHAGPVHLLGNLAGLLWLGVPTVAAAGHRAFVAIWAAGAVGGGLGYAVLAQGPAPMVGASGAVFGLAGGILVMEWRRRRRRGATGWALGGPALGFLALLVAVNLLGWVERDGLLAWQAHLGGALAGAAVAAIGGLALPPPMQNKAP